MNGDDKNDKPEPFYLPPGILTGRITGGGTWKPMTLNNWRDWKGTTPPPPDDPPDDDGDTPFVVGPPA